MSLLFSSPSQLCHRKPVTTRSSLFLLSNGFPSSSLQIPPSAVSKVHASLQTPPRSILDMDTCGKEMEKKVPQDLMKEMGTIGASHGWVATLKSDGKVSLQDDLNSVASETSPKRISLTPFVTLPHCQTQIVTNMAMSSSSPEDEDCIVAFKFLGPQLSFCKPSAQTNPEWINVKIESPSFFSAPVMFSKKDGVFRIPGSGGHLIGSWDLHKNMHIPKIQRLRFKNFPKLTETDQTLLDSCSKIEHLVESVTTGETFLVRLYKKAKNISSSPIKMLTRAAMVFKLDEEGNAFYTEDIGDLRISLSKAEPSAVIASSFPDIPGMVGNSIQLSDVDELNLIFLGSCLPIDAGEAWFPPNPMPYFIPTHF